MTGTESQALVQSIGIYSAMHFGKENLSKLAVRYSPAFEHADILVATQNNTKAERDAIYTKYIEEIIPLYASETTLTLRFFEDDAPIFDEARAEAEDSENAKAKSFVMA